MSWIELGLHGWIQGQLQSLNIPEPNEIQKDCIPQILKGKDCIGCAKTGSGKTAVFALPILQTLSEDPFGVCALVLTPTRELASQIADQFKAFGSPIQLKVVLVVGGESITHQSINLSRKPHVVIATPGRLASFLRENADIFHLKKLKYLVLDEVDALLVPGDLEEDIQEILSHLPKPEYRQTLAFSATSTGIIDILRRSLKPELHVHISEDFRIDKLEEFYFTVKNHRDSYLVYILKTKLNLNIEVDDHGKYVTKKGDLEDRTKEHKQAIVFCPSVWECHVLGSILIQLGFSCSVLHSALSQNLRTKNLMKFRSKHTRILISTSLAGRGLDIPSVDLVINFYMPYSSSEYVHHVGRTARAERPGTAITFIASFEKELIEEELSKVGKILKPFVIEDMTEAEKFVKCCTLMRKELSTDMYNNEESLINRHIERRKKIKK